MPSAPADPAGSGEKARSDGVIAWLGQALDACRAFEWIAFAYLAISGALIVIFHRNLQSPLLHIALRIVIALTVLTIVEIGSARPSGFARFVRHWYPQALFLFCFEELRYIVHVIFPGWFDGYLIAFDFRLTGANPTVWLQQFARPWFNDFMQMSYLTYFFYLIVLGAILYRHHDEGAFWMAMTGSMAAYAMGYLIAVVFPIESPYHSLRALHTVELRGGFFTAVVNFIERFGRVHGGAFPSAHVAGSLVALLSAWRCRRWLFWVYLPFFTCMMLATVYGRYHYVADVLAGLITGALGFWTGAKLVACDKYDYATAG